MMTWIRIEARYAVPPQDWSQVAVLFSNHGCQETQQTDRPPALIGYVPQVPGWQRRLDALTGSLEQDGASVLTSTVEEQDWAESWKAHFKPMRIGRRWVVRPTWESPDLASDDLEIVLDPGQAFGTGDHATTSMCLRLLEEVPVAGRTVLDVGCGSGILSIGAAKLGADRVLSVDIEPGAVEAARLNAERNGVRIECRQQDALGESRSGQWDVILSNIISATLIRIAPSVRSHLAPGGDWIVSGIIQANWADVLEAAERTGLSLERRLDEGEWVAGWFRNPGDGHAVR